MSDQDKSRVNLKQMRVEFDKFRESAKTGPNKGKITFRAVANIIEGVHLEGTVRGFRLEADEPEERGGTNQGPAPLSYFLIGAAFESVSFAVSIKSSAPEEQVRKLILHAERGCHADQTFRKPIPVTTTATLNGKKLYF